jgi:hypothetical protein
MGQLIKDVKGEVYGNLVIIENLPSKKFGAKHVKRVKVRCICGVEKEVTYRDLTRGDTKSCGCLRASIKTEVSEGDTYNFWTVIRETEGYFDKRGNKEDRSFLCQCVCGKQKEVNLQSLKKEHSKSCGCRGIIKQEKIVKEKIIPKNTLEEQWEESISYHGYYISTLGRLFNYKNQFMFNLKKEYLAYINNKGRSFQVIDEMYKTFIAPYNSETHKVFLKFGEKEIKTENLVLIETNTERVKKLKLVYGSMKSRCNNPNCKDYKSYGARGIKVEESFNTLYKFTQWCIEQGYEVNKKLEIDRKDNNKNYSSDNCRIVSKEENLLNMESIKLTFDDVAFIRSKDFDINNIPSDFKCSKEVIGRILNYKTFKNI